MPRSVKVRPELISKVKTALSRRGYIRQTDLAEYIQISQSTISSFLNGRPVDYLNFIEICRALGLEWQDIADLTLETSTDTIKVVNQTQSISSLHSLEHPSGQVPLESQFYIKRPPIEAQCYAQINKPEL